MPKKITPSELATSLKWDIGDITDFCADALEEANDHNISAALRALNAEEYELAREFISLEEEQASAGELTPELSTKRDELMARLDEAEGEEEHVHDDDCRSYGCPKGEGRR
jgi:hypothetical protein